MKNKNKNNLYHKIIKYLIIALVIFISIKYIPDNKILVKENIMISAIASITFAILDMVSPSIKV
jgi:uncharacterized MnhB-related membrane protein